jgi:hypothetical protein
MQHNLKKLIICLINFLKSYAILKKKISETCAYFPFNCLTHSLKTVWQLKYRLTLPTLIFSQFFSIISNLIFSELKKNVPENQHPEITAAMTEADLVTAMGDVIAEIKEKAGIVEREEGEDRQKGEKSKNYNLI